MTPFVALLGEQHGHVAAANVGELGGEGINRDALHGAGLPLEGVVGKKWPATNHGPAGDIGVGLHHLLNFGGGILGGFFMIINIADRDAGIF